MVGCVFKRFKGEQAVGTLLRELDTRVYFRRHLAYPLVEALAFGFAFFGVGAGAAFNRRFGVQQVRTPQGLHVILLCETVELFDGEKAVGANKIREHGDAERLLLGMCIWHMTSSSLRI